VIPLYFHTPVTEPFLIVGVSRGQKEEQMAQHKKSPERFEFSV